MELTCFSLTYNTASIRVLQHKIIFTSFTGQYQPKPTDDKPSWASCVALNKSHITLLLCDTIKTQLGVIWVQSDYTMMGFVTSELVPILWCIKRLWLDRNNMHTHTYRNPPPSLDDSALLQPTWAIL